MWLEREHTGNCGENERSQWELQLQLRETMFPSLLMQVLRNLSLPEAGHCPLLTPCLALQVLSARRTGWSHTVLAPQGPT